MLSAIRRTLGLSDALVVLLAKDVVT